MVQGHLQECQDGGVDPVGQILSLIMTIGDEVSCITATCSAIADPVISQRPVFKLFLHLSSP